MLNELFRILLLLVCRFVFESEELLTKLLAMLVVCGIWV